jgi:hypothetical protein
MFWNSSEAFHEIGLWQRSTLQHGPEDVDVLFLPPSGRMVLAVLEEGPFTMSNMCHRYPVTAAASGEKCQNLPKYYHCKIAASTIYNFRLKDTKKSINPPFISRRLWMVKLGELKMKHD